MRMVYFFWTSQKIPILAVSNNTNMNRGSRPGQAGERLVDTVYDTLAYPMACAAIPSISRLRYQPCP